MPQLSKLFMLNGDIVALGNAMWLDVRTGLGVISIIVGSIAATLPEPYSKYAFAVALALSNAAIYIKTETKTQAKTLPEPA